MKPTLILVNGEEFWDSYFPDCEVQHIRLQTSRWLLHEGKLWVFDTTHKIKARVDNILWRIQAVRPFPHYHAILELIRYAQVPCVNPVSVMLRSLDRLSMLNELREIGLPVVPFTGVAGAELMSEVMPQLPSVIKFGSYHAGYGKMRLTDLEQWQDMVDLVIAMPDYFTIEPFIQYQRDIRCLAVRDQVWALARHGSRWKANTGTVDNQLIPAPKPLYDFTLRAVEHFQADVLALDFLHTVDDEYLVVESNDTPGLAGFPSSVIEAIVRCMHERMNA